MNNLFQMMMARRMQTSYGRQQNMGATSAGCGCVSGLVALAMTFGGLYMGYRIYDSSMDIVDDSMDQAEEMVDDALEEFQSGDISGIDHDGTYECTAGEAGAEATLTVTNTGTEEQTYELTWELFAVPTDFDTDFTDPGDLDDLVDIDTDELLGSIDDTIVVPAGETVERTYEVPELTDENVGCSTPFLTSL